jgi:hypothetical protein
MPAPAPLTGDPPDDVPPVPAPLEPPVVAAPPGKSERKGGESFELQLTAA